MKELKRRETEDVNAGLGPFLTAFVSGMGVGAIKMLVDGINGYISQGQKEDKKDPIPDTDPFLTCYDGCVIGGKLYGADETLEDNCSQVCGFKYPIGVSYKFLSSNNDTIS